MHKESKKPLLTDTFTEKFVLRLPQGMRAKIHQAANYGRRSMNKEMVARLEHSLANFETVSGEISELVPINKNVLDLANSDVDENDKAYTEVLLNNKLRQKIAELSYERKCALLKFL